MRAMILAAGRGERMRDLTEHTPKPLLKVAGRYLIEHSINSLKAANIHEVVINVCYKAEMIQKILGDGTQYGIRISYSVENEALETGGGIYSALPLLGKDPFIVLSCDIVTDYPLRQLPKEPLGLAHLVLVDNPDFHRAGDFSLKNNQIIPAAERTYTFANIGVYRPELFADCKPGRFKLGALLKAEIDQGNITGECYTGLWHNIGTPEQLQAYNEDANYS